MPKRKKRNKKEAIAPAVLSPKSQEILERNEKKFSNQQHKRQDFVAKLSQQRKARLQGWYKNGRKVFIAWTKKYYRLSSGEPLSWKDPALESFYSLLGHPLIEKVIVEKAAQLGYTEGLVALTAFFLGYLHLPIVFGFEEQKKLRENVSTRIQPAFDHCEPIQSLGRDRREFVGRGDVDNKESITVAGVTLSLFYARRISKENDDAPPTLRSYPGCAVLGDEFNLWPKGVLDMAIARMAASKLPTKIIRAGSTPSYEGSILDVEVKKAKYVFNWEVTCPHCGERQFLDPFGNFLRSHLILDGEIKEISFVSLSGRPLRWFHRYPLPEGITAEADLSEEEQFLATQSAFIGCQKCEEELTKEVINAGGYRCEKTLEFLTDFCDRITREKEIIPESEAVVIRLSPIVSRRFNCTERLRRLLSGDNPANEIQQQLGKPISISGGKINLRRMLDCVNLPLPEYFANQKPDFISVGIDQGRPHYAVVQEWYLDKRQTSKILMWEQAHIKIVFWGEIPNFGKTGLSYIEENFKPDIYGIDNEPEYGAAKAACLENLPTGINIKKERKIDYSIAPREALKETPREIPTYHVENPKKGQVYLFDQMELKGTHFKRRLDSLENTTKGRERETQVPVYNLDRTYGLDEVRRRIYLGLMHLPAGTEYDPTDKGNFIYQHLTSERTKDAKWEEPPSQPDHYHHANCFGIAAALVAITEPGLTGFSYSSIKPK